MADSNSKYTTYPFTFTGKGSEYFKIWLANILLSVVTLGIYSAWAKVRTRRYFYGNTLLNGASFNYHATPVQILKERIIAVVFIVLVCMQFKDYSEIGVNLIALLFLVCPWIIWHSYRSSALMTGYRDVRFQFKGQCFRVVFIVWVLPQFLMVVLAFPAILMTIVVYKSMDSLLSMFLITQGEADSMASFLAGCIVFSVCCQILLWIIKLLSVYHVGNLCYGNAPFTTRFKFGDVAMYFLQTLLVVLFFLLCIAGLLLVKALFFGEMIDDAILFWNSGAEEAATGLRKILDFPMGVIGILLSMICTLAAATGVYAYFKARMRNSHLNKSSITPSVRFQSTMSFLGYWRILFGNFILLLVTLGVAYPWAVVRSKRFAARHTAVLAQGTLDDLVDEQVACQSSIAAG